MVDHPMIFVAGLLTYLPMIFLLLMRRIMQTKTTGSRMPFITCDQRLIAMSGAFGIRIIPAARRRMPV